MKEMPGARESNAGDDFHFIWSAKKALHLLEPHTDFEALCVEGPNIEDSIIFEDDGNTLLSIDVAEYFGGKKYEDATQIIFSQLKYSTRHGNLPWTLSSLSATTNVKKDNSIIQRLAQTYKGFLKKHPKDIEKLKLKLVTNRAIDEKLKNILYNCTAQIEKNSCTKYFELKKLLPQENRNYLKLFYEGTKLNTTEFIGFIGCVDLSDCGIAIRDIQESEVISSLAKLGIVDLKINYDKLIQFIRKQMSPEENEAVPIDKNIMASFFNTIPNGLFPSNPLLIKPQKFVKRDISVDIFNEIITNRKQHICLYATGGIGKTTVISDLGSDLPSGSVVLLYDCFGGGSYLDPSTPLHTYKNAIVQLSNELALKCYTPFLVRTNLDESDYLQSFSTRLKQASEYVKEFNQEAIILIILDAVDNSYSASEVLGDKCFVDKLLRITLPENVSILITSRTERLENFQLPYGTTPIELKGFNEGEQRNYIDMFYENVTDFQCDEVRRLTNGNPRVQYYVFSKVSDNIEEALTYLNPNGISLKGIFEEAIKKVDKRIPSEVVSFEELCRALVELPRPIPVDIITSSTDYDTEKLASACSEYLIGVYFGNGVITFRDEDFEDYLSTTAKSNESVIMKISETLYNRRFDNYYSVKYLHIFLEKAQRLNEILDSIYTVKNISISLIEDERNEILSRRIKSAFSINDICNKDYRLDAYKLLYLQTKCKAADSGVKEIILENIGLAKKLEFESTISRYILETSEFHSLNELTLQTYANSLLENNERADQFFAAASVMIKQYLEEKGDDRNFQHRVKTSDISQLAIYMAMRYDAERAVKCIHGWSPYPAQEYFNVTYSLLLHGDIEKAESIIRLSDDIDMFAACAVAFVELNYLIKDEFWIVGEKLTNHIEKEKQIHVIDFKYRISLAEMLLKRGKTQESKNIADNTEIAMDYSYLSFHEMNGELPKEYAFRLYALKKYIKGENYSFEDFWTPDSGKYEKYSEREIREKRDELKRIIDFIINSFFVRVKMMGSIDIDKANMDESRKELSNCEGGSYQFYNDHNANDYYKIITRNIFYVLLIQEKNLVKEYCEKFLLDSHFDNNFHFKVIHDIIKGKKYIDVAAWYLNELDKKVNKYPQSAYDLKKFYLKCSKKAVVFDKRLAYDYFIKAINAATGVDEEAYRRIDLYTRLSTNYIEDENAPELAYNFVRIIEDSYRRLDDKKNLPESNIFKLITSINPSAAIAAACRLEDRDEDYITLGFEISIPYIIKELLHGDKISIEIATALSNIDINYGKEYDNIVDMVLERLSGEKKGRAEKVIKAITYDIEKICGGPDYLSSDPWEIFLYMESMSAIDNGENCSRLLEWCCAEEITNVHTASGDGVYTTDKEKRFSVEESIAFYLIKMLGHVEKEKRWYAVHAIYSLYKLDEGQVIDKIVEFIFGDIPELYKDEQYIYFKDTAIIYLLVALRKIVKEDDLLVRKYIPVLENLALTDKTINILQRELAKEIVMIINPLSKEILTSCDVVSKETVKSQIRYLHNKEDRKTEFQFDITDIVPKVYYFLGQIFQKSEGETMDECDKLISSWGITNEMVMEWNKKYKTNRYLKNSYGLDSAAEDLSKYVQYNAMFYIADEYRKTLSVSDDEYPIYTFNNWVQSWLTKIPGSWVSDIKTLPPNKKIFLDVKKHVEEAKYVINDDVFDKAFWYIYQKRKYFILYSNNSIEYEHSSKRYSMSVGIMDKKHINKFLKQAKRDNYWIEGNFIANEDKRYNDGFIEDVTGEYYGKESSFETFDPYTNGINYSLLKPNRDIEHFLKIADISPENYSITKDKSYPIKAQYWSYANDDRMYNLLSQGEMLFIQEEDFLEYLNSKPNAVVVAQMNVMYSDGYKEYGEKAEEAEKRRIIILDSSLENILQEVEVKIKNMY